MIVILKKGLTFEKLVATATMIIEYMLANSSIIVLISRFGMGLSD
jgi:hypothetical protein